MQSSKTPVSYTHLDTTFANKGIGVRSICKTLDIALAGVMAFGDNYNDVSMLDIVGVPYIMDGAAAPLREKYPNHTPLSLIHISDHTLIIEASAPGRAGPR